ncbi:MAG TPA: alkaline phosphatase family protein [Flavobacteriales bacterium]|nr:alkaline phosphatase family protein [Flavobacteriales bacterium]
MTRTRGLGFLFTIAASFAGLTLHAQGPAYQHPPKLVVGIVVDQMRTDYIYRYWDNFGEGGFKRLCTKGAFLRDAHFDYTPTETGPGHASVYTGTSPARHGVVANEMFVRATGGKDYCASAHDSIVGVGLSDELGRRSPRNLLATTMADELERRFDGKAKTIGIAMKDRGAILPIGRTGDAAFWFGGGADGAFGTSTWYMKELPDWLQRFNGERLANGYLGRTWDLLLPRERYSMALPDDNPYEHPLSGAASATLPIDLHALFKASGSTGLITQTPWGNTLTTDLALAAIAGEQLGLDGITDLLAVSYSSPDILGHRMGPRALELEDMYLRLDLDIARLLEELDRRVGQGEYMVFLTADHAAVDVPSYLASLRGSAGYPDMQAMERGLQAALAKRFGPGKWVRTITNEQVFLNDSLIAAKKLDAERVQRAAADHLLTDPLIAEAVTASDLVRFEYTDGLRRLLQRGYMPQRSGDVLFAYRPGYFEGYGAVPTKGTTHGSGWNYDTHVPILFYGHGIRPGNVLRRTSITDIVPTLCMIVGMTMPNASTGHLVTEALVR